MPKDKEEKKKLVVVEEVEVNDSPKEEIQKESEEVASNDKINDEVKSENEEVKTTEVHNDKPMTDVQKVEEDDLEYHEKSQGLMWIIVLTALLVGALAGGFITYFSGLSRIDEPQPTPTSIATTEEPTTPTPTPVSSGALNRADLKMQVLNGSGVSGAAGKVKAALEKLGYTNITAANANSSDLAQTEISITKAKEGYLDMIKTDLGSDYTASKTIKTLPTSSKFDVIITLGKK